MAKATHIIAVLDRSGSMSGLETEVISNFNHFLKEQQEVEGKAKLTLVLFDHEYELVYDEVDIHDAKPITSDIYFARGMTALYDSLGKVLVDKQKKKKGIVFVHTDGQENNSHEWDKTKIKNLVNKLKEKWQFIFVGADIDAAAEASNIGIDFNNTIQVQNNAKGLTQSYAVFCSSATAYRTGDTTLSSVNLHDVKDWDDYKNDAATSE